MRGGYRPGGGRPKGSKDTKPRKGTEAHYEAEKIKAMLKAGAEARKKLYYDYLMRVKKGESLTAAEIKLMDQIGGELAAETGEGKTKGNAEKLDPLTHMLRVMNDPDVDKETRLRAASLAAPYVHPRKGEAGTGKKDEQNEKAKQAGAGKFAPSKPPLPLALVK